MSIGDWTIAVEPKRIRKLFENNLSDWCQCEGCENWRQTRTRFMPKDLLSALESMGLTPGDSPGSDRGESEIVSGLLTTRPIFAFPGEVISWGKNAVQEFSEGTTLSVIGNPSRHVFTTVREGWPDLPSPLLYVCASMVVPWLPDEMCSFDTVEREYCPSCRRSKWRIEGRLTPASRIPEWYGARLEGSSSDYDVSFCHECGEPTFRLFSP